MMDYLVVQTTRYTPRQRFNKINNTFKVSNSKFISSLVISTHRTKSKKGKEGKEKGEEREERGEREEKGEQARE